MRTHESKPKPLSVAADGEGGGKQLRHAAGDVEDEYLLGLNGEQVSVLNGTGQRQFTNVYAGGKELATYYGSQLYFALTDWLGTKRAEAEVQVCNAE